MHSLLGPIRTSLANLIALAKHFGPRQALNRPESFEVGRLGPCLIQFVVQRDNNHIF